MLHFSKEHPGKNGGFSLVELLVSIGIITTIVTVVVFNQNTYSEAANLTNTADALSLSIAEAQAYGIAVKEREPGSDDFTSGYGLSLSTLDSGSDGGYIFFADRNESGHYDGDWDCVSGGSSECLEKVLFGGGSTIESFCTIHTSGPDQCGPTGRIDISFLRPDVSAQFAFFTVGGGQYFPPSNTKGVRVVLQSQSGLERSVVVYTTGQVSVE